MSTAEDLIRSHEDPSVAHHLTFSLKKKEKKEIDIIQFSDQASEHTKFTKNELGALYCR